MTEFTGRTPAEAIEAGLQELGLSQDNVDIEILEEGRGGVFGLGSRPARVRLTPRSTGAPLISAPAPETAPPPAIEPAATAAPTTEPASPPPLPPAISDEQQRALDIARDFLQKLLDHMELSTRVEASLEPSPDEDEEEMYYLNIAGDDLSVLIGRRAETLEDLQYLVRLVVNQHTHRWPHIEVDVEHYKQRRRRGLQRLAEQMAARAVAEHRTVILEAMPPRERRIIHIALRERTDVITQSVGEGENRKVTIIPK